MKTVEYTNQIAPHAAWGTPVKPEDRSESRSRNISGTSNTVTLNPDLPHTT